MSGEDQSFIGEAFPGDGISISSCIRELKLDPRRTSSATSKRALHRLKAILTRYDEVNEKLGEDLSPEEMDKVLEEQAEATGTASTRSTCGTSIRASSWRWTPCDFRRQMPTSRSCPAVSAAALRCAGCCCSRPTCCCSTNRRTISTPESVAWLERSSGLRRHGRRRHPRSLLPRQRRRAGFSNSTAAAASRGRQLLVVARAEAEPARAGRERPRPGVNGRSNANSSGFACHRARRHAKGKARLNAYEDLLREDTAREDRTGANTITPGQRLGDIVVVAWGTQGYGDNLLIDGLDFTLPRGGIVGVIGPNGAGKTTLFRMITGRAARRRNPASG